MKMHVQFYSNKKVTYLLTYINFEKSHVFCAKKCGRPHLKNPPCPPNVRTKQPPDCGRLLWTAQSGLLFTWVNTMSN